MDETKNEADAIAPANDRSVEAPADRAPVGRAYYAPDLICSCGARFGSRENLKEKDGTLTGEIRVTCSTQSCKYKGVELIVVMIPLPVRLAEKKK